MKKKARQMVDRIKVMTGCEAMYSAALGMVQLHNASKERIWNAIMTLKHTGELKFESCERRMDGEYVAIFHVA